ncbi:MAG: DUF368 domain-containing protein [Acidobacteriota bacterium]
MKLPWDRFLGGLAIGAADGVPGVSGGTIALLLGLYERLLESAQAVIAAPFTFRDPSQRPALYAGLRFLVPLGAGVVTAYLIVTKLLVGKTGEPGLLLRAESAPYLYALFFGLVLGSAWVVWGRVPEPRAPTAAWLLLGTLVSYSIIGIERSQDTPATWTLLPGAAVAISAMLLPGVSGSMVLLILGQYVVVSQAVHDRNLPPLMVFGCGILLGAAVAIPVLKRVLARWPRAALATLTGLMLGSLRATWPYKDGYDPKVSSLSNRFDLNAIGVGEGIGVIALVGFGFFLAWAADRFQPAKDGDAEAAPAEA